ncbi:MAG TPA: AMP-dependent synthetase [Firmicutes bacterium]|nr:AMP-dependent synthetase [Bacillota bacterium]
MGILDMKFFSLIGFKKKPHAVWKKYYAKKDMNFDVPNISIYQYIKNKSLENNYKDSIAIEYFGTKITYTNFYKNIDKAAKSFRSQGVRRGDVVTILSANIPEAVISFYALNKIGAVANMIHPLSSENEIKEALNRYSTVMLVAMDITYSKIKNIINDTEVYKTIIISAKDSMSTLMKIGYEVTQGYKVEKPKKSEDYLYWKDFIKFGEKYSKDKVLEETKRDTPAVILHSGGTTGTPKGIVLSNGNFNAATIQSEKALPDLDKEDVILAIMPIFHGFGLSVSITDAFAVGAKVVLIPTFKASEFDKLITKNNPSVLVGVPTLFEALTTNERMEDVNLSNLKYVIGGGDTLSKKRVEAINKFLHEHGANTNFTQGYGMTEAVACISFDLKYASRPGTVGIPWPGTYVQITKPGTDEPVGIGEDGEICICGPTVMLGYYNNEKETNEALHIHKDGNVWLHSGDIGTMDKDGFITYKQRLKRMIVTSGYNVYPSQIEEVIERHPAVMDSSVIGIPHPYKVEVAKAFIALKQGYKDTPKLRAEIEELCKKNLAAYSIPKEYEFRKSLPKTMIGKVDFRKLQQENNEKRMEERHGKK